MASKNFERLAALTASIAPVKDQPPQPAKMKTAPGQLMELVMQRDAAEAKVAELEAALKAAQSASAIDSASAEELASLKEANEVLKQARDESLRLQSEYEAKAAEQVQQLEEELRKAKESGGSLEIPLSRLVEVAGRRRKLNEQEYSDLKDNLANNDLASPITVRPLKDGNYEIVSGHNRVAIYRELGRTSIQAWPRDVSDDQAEDMAFFANAMAAKLPDYSKYLGYKRFIDKHPGIERQELAAKVGISDSHLSRLLKFDAFPEEAHAILEAQPWLIGAATATAMAKLLDDQGDLHVLKALKGLADGEFKTEAQALAAATKASKPVKASTSLPATSYKLGRNSYAEHRLVSKTLRVDFASEEEARVISDSLKELIEQRLAELRAAK